MLEIHEFYCTKCGRAGLPLPRRKESLREKGHLKKLWCPWCKEEVNHYECRNYEEVEQFMEFFIGQQLKEHYKHVCELYPEDEILGVFLYGSQNYNCATDSSDVDSKAIIVPSLDRLIEGKMLSKELHVGESHCEVKDIREMGRMWLKGNMNFVEILFTDYYIVNPRFQDFWQKLVDMRDEIAYYNPKRTILSLGHQALNGMGYDAKRNANAYKLSIQMGNYLTSANYEQVLKLTNSERALFLDYKQEKLEVPRQELSEAINRMMDEGASQEEPHEETAEKLQQTIKEGIKAFLN